MLNGYYYFIRRSLGPSGERYTFTCTMAVLTTSAHPLFIYITQFDLSHQRILNLYTVYYHNCSVKFLLDNICGFWTILSKFAKKAQ